MHLVVVGSSHENNWAISWNVVRASGPYLSEENAGYGPEEDQHTIIDEVRGPHWHGHSHADCLTEYKWIKGGYTCPTPR